MQPVASSVGDRARPHAGLAGTRSPGRLRGRPGDLRRAGVAAVAVVVVLAGCWSAPDDPAPTAPVPTDAAPIDDERLELVARACGGPVDDSAPAAFPGDLAPTEQSGTTSSDVLTATLRIDLTSDHGEHSADLAYTSGLVSDEDGTVVGVVTGISFGEVDERDESATATLALTVGACATGGADLGATLPDGTYRLELVGMIRPLDHDHAEQEQWATAPVELTLDDGAVELS